MKQRLVAKAQELRQHGFTTGEIADELNVSMDTKKLLKKRLTHQLTLLLIGKALEEIPPV